ncbi:hypothetical protein GQ457_06G032750 [Hibiscus cannabinus]
MSSPSVALSPDQLCYVHCNLCDTVLALTLFFCPPMCSVPYTRLPFTNCFSISIGLSFVFVSSQVSVPCSSLLKTVTVRCGHCTNLLSVNMRGLLLPAANQLHLAHSFFTPRNLLCTTEYTDDQSPGTKGLRYSIEEQMRSTSPNVRWSTDVRFFTFYRTNFNAFKRQRVPSAWYNRFIKDEIQRIKAENPDIWHRDAFIAAAKNLVGLMPDQAARKTNIRQQEREVLVKDGYFMPTNVGVSPCK